MTIYTITELEIYNEVKTYHNIWDKDIITKPTTCISTET